MNEKRNGSLEKGADNTYLGSTLTFFDHRVADAHSFAETIAQAIKVKYTKPYAEGDTPYSHNEADEFEAYWKPYKEWLGTE